MFNHSFGADIDEKVLFQAEGITTFKVDQLQIKSLETLRDRVRDVSPGIALLIDDGLHNFEAARNTLVQCWPLLIESGVHVIEDILPYNLAPLLEQILDLNPSSWGMWANTVLKHDYLALFARK